MTLHEIESYLRKNQQLLFKYRSEFYTIRKNRSFFRSRYSLITEDLSYQKKSLEALCKEARICNDIVLVDAINDMIVPEEDDSVWETYEAIRHQVIVHGAEINFSYHGRNYWIAHTRNGSHLSDELGNHQYINSRRELFEHARIDGKPLKDIWEEVTILSC